MSTLSYPHAKNLLSGVEKERIVCTYLNSSDPLAHVDWTKAAQQFGSASIESYKKLMHNTAKKIKQAMDDGVEPEAEVEGAKKKGGGKKRKADVEGEVTAASKKKKGGKGKKVAVDRVQSEEDVDGEAEVAPKKKKGGKGKKTAVKQEGSEAEDGE